MSEQFKDLMELFIRTDALLHRYQGTYFRNFGPFASPHKGQGRVLSLLKLQPEITQKELGYLLDMRNQSLGELLGKLERNGYITRTPSEKDRRIMNIRLTDEGAKAAAQLDGKQEDVNQIFSCLSEEEQAVLSDYLERLIDTLEKTFEEMGIPEHEHGRPCGHPHPHGHPHEHERDFGGPQGFGSPFASRHDPRASFTGRPGFPGTPKHPERPEGHRHEEAPGYAEHPHRHGQEDFSGYAELPGRHIHEDFCRNLEHPESSEHPEPPFRPEFSEGFNCPKHLECHEDRCPECDFTDGRDAENACHSKDSTKDNNLDSDVHDSDSKTNDTDAKNHNTDQAE